MANPILAEKHHRNKCDGIYGHQSGIVAKRKTTVSWWTENSSSIVGPLLGSFLAALVALISIYFTNRNNIRLQNNLIQRKQAHNEDVYCGYLFAIFHEINWHQNLLLRLRNELVIIRNQALADLRFNIPVAHELFRIEYINSYRINTLKFERFDTDLLALISTYLNLIMTINSNLHFEYVQNLRLEFESDEAYRDGLIVFFDELEGFLSRAEGGMANIQAGIVEVVRTFPGNQIIFEDNATSTLEQQPNKGLELTHTKGSG